MVCRAISDTINTLGILARLIGFPTVSRQSNRDLISYVTGLLNGAGIGWDVIESLMVPGQTCLPLWARKISPVSYCLATLMLCQLRGKTGLATRSTCIMQKVGITGAAPLT